MQKSHKISIHAPTRGATYAQSATENVDVYFNPRSHEGSDLRQSASTCQKSFQSTLPRGERQAADSIQARKGIISIHAPTRGATKQYRAKTNVNAKFQSTLPRGERQISTYPVLWRQKFQSTLPRGERLPVQINILPALFISIHAPTRGATLKIGGGAAPIENFNPRSHEGSDWRKRYYRRSFRNFNPRSHEGSDG